MGRRFPDGGLLRYRKWVPQQLGDVNKQESGDSRPIGARHGDTAANHTDLQSGCGRPCVFAVRLWSNLWDLTWLRTSHYSMVVVVSGDPGAGRGPGTTDHWCPSISWGVMGHYCDLLELQSSSKTHLTLCHVETTPSKHICFIWSVFIYVATSFVLQKQIKCAAY